jgi:hypothetical protein
VPEICRFCGIVIYIFRELGGRHHYPHIHAKYAEHKAVFNIETAELMEGTLPRKERRLVEAWIELRRNELRRNWGQLNVAKGEPAFDPIR